MKKIFKTLLLIIIYIAIVYIILWKMNLVTIQIKNPNSKENSKTVDEYIDNDLSLEDKNLQITKGTENKFYYNQLDETSKAIYDKILESKDKLKSGTSEIEFNNHEFDYILSQENGMEILSQKFTEAIDSIKYDHVEIFYIDYTKMVIHTITHTVGNNESYEVFLSLAPTEESYLKNEFINKNLEIVLDEVETLSDEILSKAEGTDYQKIQYIHNWIVDNLEYDTTYKGPNNLNIYGALVERKVVCEGYAKLFKYLLDKEQIPCILVTGNALNSIGEYESHMWNYVKINDTWYAFDVTWDDPILTNGGELPEANRYQYFCQGDNINTNHFLIPSISEEGKEYEFPELYHKEK